eukprot:2706140-Pyramimonas_sp.AAC.2
MFLSIIRGWRSNLPTIGNKCATPSTSYQRDDTTRVNFHPRSNKKVTTGCNINQPSMGSTKGGWFVLASGKKSCIHSDSEHLCFRRHRVSRVHTRHLVRTDEALKNINKRDKWPKEGLLRASMKLSSALLTAEQYCRADSRA